MMGWLRGRFARLLFELDPSSITFISIPLIVFSIFLIYPLSEMLVIAFTKDGSPSLSWFMDIFSSRFYIDPVGQGSILEYSPEYNLLYIQGRDHGVILNSLIVAASVSILAGLFGLLMAFILARYEFPGKSLFRVLSMTPLLLSPFVNVFVVKKLFEPFGLINWLLHEVLRVLPFRVYFDGLAAVVLVQSLTFYPIVTLNTYSALMNIDPTMEEQGENLGAKGLRLFLRVTLPLSLPGLLAGSLLVFIFSLEDLGAPIVFHGHPLTRKLISFQVYSRFISETGARSPEIAALSLILLACAISVFLVIKNYVSLRPYATVSRGGRWKPRLRRLGLGGMAAVYLMLPLLVFSSLPQFGVAVLAFSERWAGMLPEGPTIWNLAQIFVNPKVSRYLINSLIYALVSLALMVSISLMASYATSRLRFSGVSLIDALVTSPIAIPGIAIAIAYFYFFSNHFRGSPLDPINVLQFNPAPILILGYSLRRMPFAARAIFAGLQQVHVNLEEAAMNLGAGRLRTIARVTVPLISLNILSGALTSFVYVVGEVSLSIIIGVLNMEYAPMTAYMRDVWLSAVGSLQIAAALGLLLMLMQLSVILITTVGLKQRYAFMGV
ncbi:MAG: iron ABC transporter permease [Candidatus Bathyarchaeia archaeon]